MGVLLLNRVRSGLSAGFVALLLLGLLSACHHTMWQARFYKPRQTASLEKSAPFLKCHTRDGEVFVLKQWRVLAKERIIEGTGLLYDTEREVVARGRLKVPMEHVVLLETNRPHKVRSNTAQIAVLTVMSFASLTLTGVCVASPKTCFGSCPTFYASNGHRMVLQAEGFSASVARSLEASDVDSLYAARPGPGPFTVRMTNEALETHAVRSVRLLAAPRPPGGRVLRAGGTFYPATRLRPPTSCETGTGGISTVMTSALANDLGVPLDKLDALVQFARYPAGMPDVDEWLIPPEWAADGLAPGIDEPGIEPWSRSP